MRAVLALARLELRRAFRTPVGFAVAGLYLLVHGFYFVSLMGQYSTSSLQSISLGQAPNGLNLVDMVLQPLASADTFLLLMLLPGLSMRLLSDEWRSGTSELLLSYPMRGRQIVAGKFLGAVVMLLLLLVLGCAAIVGAAFFGQVEFPTAMVQVLALFAFGLCCLAIGTLYSAITENQVLAYGLTVVTLFTAWFLGWWSRTLEGFWSELVGWLSPASHFTPASLGLLRLGDLVFFVGVVAFSLHLAVGAVEARRAGRGELRRGTWLLSTTLWLVALGLAGALSTRNELSLDLSYGERRSLTPETQQLLAELDRPVHVLAFYAQDPTEREAAQRLLGRYQKANPLFTSEFVDLDRRPELAEAYEVTLNRTMVLVTEGLKLRLSEPGEAELSGALLRLLTDEPPRIAFVTGHGEASIADGSGGGLQRMAETVRQQNFLVEELGLASVQRIDPSYDAVILAAPEQPYSARELDLLTDYVIGGGRLMAMLEVLGSSSVDSLISVFGVEADPAFVIDQSEEQRNITQGASDRIALAQGGNPEHEATRDFRYVTLYPIARSLGSVQPPPPGATPTRLVETGKGSWAETDLRQLSDPAARYDEGVDREGPLPLAYAIELDLRIFRPDWRERPGGIEEAYKELAREGATSSAPAGTLQVGESELISEAAKKTRMVVLGDVDFVNNANLLAWGNSELFLKLLFWLTDQQDRLMVATGPALFDPVVLTEQRMRTLRIVGIVTIPGIFLMLGVGVSWRRRRWV